MHRSSVCHQMMRSYVRCRSIETTKDLLDEATDIVLDAGLAEKDDILVLTGGGPANHRGKGVTNMLKVVKIGEFGE